MDNGQDSYQNFTVEMKRLLIINLQNQGREKKKKRTSGTLNRQGGLLLGALKRFQIDVFVFLVVP